MLARDPQVLARGALLLIVGASLVALAWPLLPLGERQIGPSRVGVVLALIEDPAAAGQVGSAAPDFAWSDAGGQRRTLSDLRGRIVVMNFWATWCEPCREEMPALDRAARDRPDVTFLAMDVDESGEKVRAFFDSLRLERLEPVIDVGAAVARRYGVLSLPMTYFVDAAGVVRVVEVGAMDAEDIRRNLDRAR
jgi:thiol-disulfide isomerase/thioredoxin